MLMLYGIFLKEILLFRDTRFKKIILILMRLPKAHKPKFKILARQTKSTKIGGEKTAIKRLRRLLSNEAL